MTRSNEAVSNADKPVISRNGCILGITGLSGSGKTTVTRILETMGAYAVIADELSHFAILRGNAPYALVLDAFGPGILCEDSGEIDRRKLGGIVFSDPSKLKVLEDIIHPYVIAKTQALIAGARASGRYAFTVIDAPMLIEAGMNAGCGEVWLVTAPAALKAERIAARDGISREMAEKRLSVRDEEALKPYADRIIVNDGSIDDLYRKISTQVTDGSWMNP